MCHVKQSAQNARCRRRETKLPGLHVTEPQHHNWPAIIAEIEAAGISHYKLACMMHRQLNQIRRWKQGCEPRHYEGQMLLMIHAEYVRPTLQV